MKGKKVPPILYCGPTAMHHFTGLSIVECDVMLRIHRMSIGRRKTLDAKIVGVYMDEITEVLTKANISFESRPMLKDMYLYQLGGASGKFLVLFPHHFVCVENNIVKCTLNPNGIDLLMHENKKIHSVIWREA